MLVLDLGVFHRRTHTVEFREAFIWSLVWVGLAVVFAVVVYFWHGRTPSLEFITGYVIELSLSVDNLFVFLLISVTSRCRPDTSIRSCSGESWER